VAEAQRLVREAEAEEKKKELAKKRDANIAKREEERRKAAAEKAAQPGEARAKYAKSEIRLLKDIFDSYDRDKSGAISQAELKAALVQQKEAQNRARDKNKPAPSKGGVDLLQLIDPIFYQMDTNNDGTVEFKELLKVLYPRATEADFDAMLSWVDAPPPPEPEKKAEFTPEQIEEMKQIFSVYDTDKSGTITIKELQEALISTGMSRKEITELFVKNDCDTSGSLDFDEFKKMLSTGDIF